MAASTDKPTLSALSAELARRWASQRLGAVQAYGRILADFGAGRSTGSTAAGAFAKLVAEEAVRYPADAIGLASDFAGALVRNAGGTLERATSTAQARPIQDLEISGPLGGLATGEFLLSNPHDRPAAVSFATSNFSGPAGESKVSVRVEPCEFTLAGGDEQLVTVIAALDPDAFEPGVSYVANVAITGFDEMVVRVRLTVLPT